MIVWAILICNTLIGALSLALAAANEEATRAAKSVFRERGLSGMPAGCALSLVGLASVGLWTAYAVQVSDWRFAAASWIPFVLGWIGKAATGSKRRAVSS